MTQEEYYKKTDEALAKFKNGKDLYQKSALFNRTVQMLVRGVSEYEIIEQLIQTTEDNNKAMEQLLIRRIY